MGVRGLTGAGLAPNHCAMLRTAPWALPIPESENGCDRYWRAGVAAQCPVLQPNTVHRRSLCRDPACPYRRTRHWPPRLERLAFPMGYNVANARGMFIPREHASRQRTNPPPSLKAMPSIYKLTAATVEDIGPEWLQAGCG